MTRPYARASYEKHRDELRKSSLAQLQMRCLSLPLRVTMEIVNNTHKYQEVIFSVLGASDELLCRGRFELVSTFLSGYQRGWTGRKKK